VHSRYFVLVLYSEIRVTDTHICAIVCVRETVEPACVGSPAANVDMDQRKPVTAGIQYSCCRAGHVSFETVSHTGSPRDRKRSSARHLVIEPCVSIFGEASQFRFFLRKGKTWLLNEVVCGLFEDCCCGQRGCDGLRSAHVRI
jgi:hypothetical protein